ncbi:MAG: hypothetical protein ACJ771_06515 [Chloroflexota bacterium]
MNTNKNVDRSFRSPIPAGSLMTRLLAVAAAMVLAMLIVVPVTLAADPSSRGEQVVITSGADITLPADQTVDLFIVYDGTARIEGHASTIMVVNGAANVVGGSADGVIAIESQVTLDDGARISGDIRAIDSTVDGADATTVGGAVRAFGPEMFFGWPDLGFALLLMYVAFAVSAVVAGVVLAGLAARQVRAAGALITTEPGMVIGAAFVGLIGLLIAGILAMVTVVGIPFGIGLLAVGLPALFFVGYLVAGIWIGEWVLRRNATAVHERPYRAAVVGLAFVGLVGIIPPVGGLVSFVGFGAVVLLAWRVLRGAPGRAASESGLRTAAEPAG